MHILITEMAGRASVELKAASWGSTWPADPDAVGRIVDAVKAREAAGWSYEAADASFELLMRDELPTAAMRRRRRRAAAAVHPRVVPGDRGERRAAR